MKNRPNLRLVTDDENSSPHSSASNEGQGDGALLDAYSQAVIAVVRSMAPTVVSISGCGRGSGSGFLVSSDGLVITNSHVADKREKLVVETAEGDRIDGRLVGDDPATDLALVRVASKDLPFAELGDSGALQVGQLTVAMGSPLGLHSTVSTGIVSALGRSLRGRDGRLIENIVQHTAPINPGNSGGPLVDSRSQVVGINTAIIANAQGLGFAVPADTATWVMKELLEHGSVRRRQLGIVATAFRLSRDAVRDHDLFSAQAIRVVDLDAKGAAAAAGVQQNDVLVEINDRIVSSVDDVHRLLTTLPAEMAMELTIIRGNAKQTVEVGV